MRICASIEPLSWESTSFSVNSTTVCFDQHAPALTADVLQSWSRVQTKTSAANTHGLDALQQLGFSLVEGEIDFVLPVMCTHGNPGTWVVQTTDIPALRQLAGQAFAQSHFRTPWYATGTSTRFYTQWIENAVLGTFDHRCLVFRTPAGDIRGYASLRELNTTDMRTGLLVERGAGAEPMQTAFCRVQTRSETTLRVATQIGSIAAPKRYIYSGANVESATYWSYR